MIKKENGKNGLVELFRFLCSIWVAYFHGFFPEITENFSGVNISIDFFFMVSGLFFLKSLDKLKEKPFWNGAWTIFWGRTKRFIVPLIIAALSILWCNIAFEWNFNQFNWPLSFLWFFVVQFIYLSIFYLIYKKIKKRSTFNIICLIILCVTMMSCLFNNETLGRIIRGMGMLALAMLVSQIPKINIKLNDGTKARRLNIFINAVGFVISAVAFAYLAYLPGYAVWKLHIFICIVCTSLLYFATALPVRSKFLNLLGELSTFIYLGQCPILLHYHYGSEISENQFVPLCICATALFVINRIVNYFIKRNKKVIA